MLLQRVNFDQTEGVGIDRRFQSPMKSGKYRLIKIVGFQMKPQLRMGIPFPAFLMSYTDDKKHLVQMLLTGFHYQMRFKKNTDL